MTSPRRRNKVLREAVALSLFSTGLCCHSTMAEEETSSDDDNIEEVVVTGSRIARRNFSAPSPIVTVDAAEIRLAGTTNVEDILNTLPQLVPDLDRTANHQGGSATINLRGLGTDRTLVMLNGRRFAVSHVGGAVDVNNIPAALIERVEIVTGGASAVYGSDAVVGVANFILDDAYQGLEVNAQYDITDESDGEVLDVSISGGTEFAGGRGHISGFFNYNYRDPILAADRQFTSVTIFDNTQTGELFEAGSFSIPEGLIFFPDTIIGGMPIGQVVFHADGTLRPAVFPDDRYNYAPDNYLQVPLARYVAASFLNFDFSLNVTGTLELLYARNEIDTQSAPTPASGFWSVTIDNPFLPAETQQIFRDSFDPDGDGLAEFFLLRRLVEVGPRRFGNTRDVLRVLAGLDGKFGDGWSWEAYYSYTDTDVDPLGGNLVFRSSFQQALLIDPSTGGCLDPSNGCVPANIYGAGNISQDAASFLRAPDFESEHIITEEIVSAATTGDLWELPAGSVAFAAGLEWRRHDGNFASHPALIANDVLGTFGFQPAIGTTEVNEAYMEILVPLLEDKSLAQYLAVEAGARTSDYNTAGRVETWKLGAEWMPTDDLRFRIMYQQAIRAPNILEIFKEQAEAIFFAFTPETDLCSASRDPVGNGLTDVCVAQGLDPALVGVFEAPDPNFVTFFSGGNPNLEPEESESLTIGFVLHPTDVENLSISLDYFDIDISDAILNIGDGALASCFAIKDPNSNLCDLYIRDATGRIAEAFELPINVAIQKSEGFDLELFYSIDTPSLALFDASASFDLSFNGTWYLTNGSQSSPITPFFDCAGYFGDSCAFSSFGTLPEIKTTTRLSYSSGPLSMSLRWRWIDGMKNSEPFFTQLFNLPDPVLAIPEIGSKNYFDLSASYDFNDSLSVYGGINNITDTDPPLLASEAPGLNTDTATYDAIGRRYFLGITYSY